MAVNAGYMRKRFILYGSRKNLVGEPLVDDVGQAIEDREVLARPWCSVKVVSSTEKGGVLNSGQLTLEFTVRWSKYLASSSIGNPTQDMYIEFEGEEYDIVSVINPRMKKEKLIIQAIKRR